MIRARVKYPNGQTAMRQGTALIDAAIAGGCVIVEDPYNRWPAGLYDAHIERANGQHIEEPPKGEPIEAQEQPKRKRGRPRIHR